MRVFSNGSAFFPANSMTICVWYLSILILIFFGGVGAIPRRGNEPWSMILCKFADLPNYEPRSKHWFQQWLIGPDSESITSFFSSASNGVYTITGSTIHGWFTLPYTQKEVLRLANSNPSEPLGSDGSFDYFDKIKELCVDTAIRQGSRLHRQKITVINAGTTAVYGKKHGVLLTPQLMFSAVLTHEMIHSFFIGHSYSDRKIRVFPYALSGEYDDRYDLMSTANAYMHRSRYGMSGPGLNGAHLDFLGWLPMDRILYFGRDGRRNYTLRLSSLSVAHNETRGWLLVVIPYDRDDPNNFYTLELRTPYRVDTGIVQASVLVHRVQKVGKSYYSVLLSQARDFYELTENTEWVKFLEPNALGHFQLIRVSVRRVYANDADISVSSTFDPAECRHGEVETPVSAENPLPMDFTTAWTTSDASLSTFLPPEASTASSLWSSEVPLDELAMQSSKTEFANLTRVCLDSRRAVLTSDFRRQIARNNFYAHQTTYGANCCRAGYVWRALDAYDYVCVTPERRDFAVKEMSRQEERILMNGTGCAEPFLPRRAYPGDEICVSPAEKFRSFRENVQSTHRLQHFAFFNGVDTVGP